MVIRAASTTLAALMTLILVRFFLQWDTLRPFCLPMVVVFFLFGWFRPSLGLYPIIFAIPLTAMVPHIHQVANFSLIEIAWWSVCLGRVARRTVAPRRLRMPPPPPWPLITLLTITVVGTAVIRLTRNFLWPDSIVLQLAWDELGNFFRMGQASRFFPFRAAVVWLEVVSFLTLVRRNAPRDAFQRRVRILLMISLALTVLICLHQFTLFVTMGDAAPQILDAWQLAPDWLPIGLRDAVPGLRAIHGTWPDVNSLASYLVMMLPLILSLMVLSRSVFGRALLIMLFLATLVALLLSFSRIAWMWVLPTLIFWGLIGRDRSRGLTAWIEGRGRWWIWAGFAGVMGVLALVTWHEPTLEVAARVMHSTPAERMNVILKGRLNLWETALRVTHEDPLFGAGWGSFYERSQHFYRPVASFTSWGREVWNPPQENAHNQFMQVLAETGLVGLCLFLLLMGQWVRMALRTLAWGRGEHRWATRGYLASLFALSGTMLTGHPLLLIEMLFLFMTILGLIFFPRRLPTSEPAGVATLPNWTGRGQVIALLLVVMMGVRIWDSRSAPDLYHCSIGTYHHICESDIIPDFQWTSERAVFLLRNVSGEVSFLLSNGRPDLQPVPVEIIIDGERRDRFTPPDHHWWPVRYEVDLPPNAIYRLELNVLNTFRNPDDPPDRFLGIRIAHLDY